MKREFYFLEFKKKKGRINCSAFNRAHKVERGKGAEKQIEDRIRTLGESR